jgi:hypothetical protein
MQMRSAEIMFEECGKIHSELLQISFERRKNFYERPKLYVNLVGMFDHRILDHNTGRDVTHNRASCVSSEHNDGLARPYGTIIIRVAV